MNIRQPPVRALLALALGIGTLAGCGTGRGMTKQDQAAFQARKQLTRQLVARSEWQSAFAYADDLHRQQPSDSEVLTLRGIVYRERNMPGEAEADLRAALVEDERNAEAHSALAVLLDASGRSDARTHHQRAVDLDANNPTYQNNLGFHLLVRAKHRDALPVLQRAARLAPTNPRVRTNLGFAFAAGGDFPRAAREFEMGGAPAEAKNNLGFAYERKGDLNNAFQLYLAALRIDPACARARSNLTELARRTGQPLPPDIQPAAAGMAAKETTP